MLVSIIIPTHNRPEWLRRAAAFYGGLDLREIGIYVIDSSDQDSALQNERIAASSSHVMHYLKAPQVPFYRKIEQALSSVPSNFVVLSADDDFHNPAACMEAARFLRNNSDFAVAHGRAFSAYMGKESCDLHPYHQSGVLSETASERVLWHLAHYCTTFYSVHRKEQAIRNMQLAQAHATEEKFGELLPSCATLVAGKSKLLDTPFMLRQGGNQAASTDTRILWEDYIGMERFAHDYAAFADALAGEIAASDKISAAKAALVVDRAFAGFLQRYPSAEFRSQAPARIRRFYPSRFSTMRQELIARFAKRASQHRPVNRSTHTLSGAEFSKSTLGKTLRGAVDLIQRHPLGVVA